MAGGAAPTSGNQGANATWQRQVLTLLKQISEGSGGSGEAAIKIWTYKVTNDSFTISESLGLTDVCIELISGAATVSGSLQVGAYPSMPLDLVEGEAFFIAPDEGSRPLDGIVIDASAGEVKITGKQ